MIGNMNTCSFSRFVALAGLAFTLFPTFAHAGAAAPRADLEPLITTIRNAPELSIFSSLIDSIGSDFSLTRPSYDGQFNDASSEKTFTIFAPTNDAFIKIAPSVIDRLKKPSSYELLNLMLRSHIVENVIEPAALIDTTITAINGFTLTINSTDHFHTNPGRSTGEIEIGLLSSANLTRTTTGSPSRIPASNGVVYRISGLLNGQLPYFGVDAPDLTHWLPPFEYYQNGTMADILNSDPELSILKSTHEQLNPDFITRLSLMPAAGKSANETLFIAFTNNATQNFPLGGSELQTGLQPQNSALVRFFLEYALGSFNGTHITSVNGFMIKLRWGKVNHARIDRRVCVSNGCVWKVNRWIDPMYPVMYPWDGYE